MELARQPRQERTLIRSWRRGSAYVAAFPRCSPQTGLKLPRGQVDSRQYGLRHILWLAETAPLQRGGKGIYRQEWCGGTRAPPQAPSGSHPPSGRSTRSSSTGRARRAGWRRLVVFSKLKVMSSLMRSRTPFCGSPRPNLTHSGRGLRSLTPPPGTAKWKTVSLRGASTPSRTKPSRICGPGAAQTGEAPGEPEILGVLSATPR